MSDYAANSDLKGWIAAEEIPDVKALQEEIKNLREENVALARKVEKADTEKLSQVNLARPANDEDLIKVLHAIE